MVFAHHRDDSDEKVEILLGAKKLSFEGCIKMKEMVVMMILFRLERTSE